MIGRLEGESSNNISKNRARNGAHDKSCSGDQGVIERRVLRSRYLAVKTFIDDDGEDLSRADSEKFKSIINEVEILHQLVQKPREQVADAESLLDISNSLLNSVKAHNNEGLSPSDFITCLLRDFGSTGSARDTVVWKDVGSAVSHRFRISSGSCTMVGPMDTELKQQKAVVRRKRVRQTESSHPEVVDDTIKEEKTDTDRNMSTMFEILKKNRSVRLERLVLNRNSFAETVENLFALSFLVKDGRAEITVNEKGCHQVSPRNALAANAVLSGEVSYSHLIFRFDFKDWKMMKGSIGVGEELMPYRNQVSLSCNSQIDLVYGEPQATTPIRKLCRNRGLVIQEQSVLEDSLQNDDTAAATATRKGKQKLGT